MEKQDGYRNGKLEISSPLQEGNEKKYGRKGAGKFPGKRSKNTHYPDNQQPPTVTGFSVTEISYQARKHIKFS